jgi:F0F1-type ATP synthase assembly protein I
MNLSNSSPGPTKKDSNVEKLAVYSVGGQVGCATIMVVLLGLFIGIGLDRLLGTKPVMVLLFVLGAGPLALVLSYFLAMRAVKEANQRRAEEANSQPAQEDEKSE